MSGGVVINPGLGKDKADLGVFGSVGTGGGVNISSDIFAGFVRGGTENIRGLTTNINIVAGPVSITLFGDPGSKEIVGGTIGFGPSATPIGASGTVSLTGTFTLRDVLRLLKSLAQENNRFWKATQLIPCE